VINEQLQKKLSVLEHMLEKVPDSHPKVAQKLATKALEEVRLLRQEVDQEDIAQTNRTLLAAKLLDRRRTRFFVAYADHGIRLSALLFVVASHTRRRWNAGKRGKAAGWRKKAEWFGAQIGISGRQIYRLVGKGRKLRLLGSVRTRRGLLVWIKNRKVYAELRENAEDEFHVGHYYLRLARLLGKNGSILYRFLKVTDEDGNRKRLTAKGAAYCFPWMSEKAASVELHRLFQAGAVRRERTRFGASANADWKYYWRPRVQEDRDRWRLFTKTSSKNPK